MTKAGCITAIPYVLIVLGVFWLLITSNLYILSDVSPESSDSGFIEGVVDIYNKFGPLILSLIIGFIAVKWNYQGGNFLIIFGFCMSIFHPRIPEFGFWEVVIVNFPANAAFTISGLLLIKKSSNRKVEGVK